MTESVSPISQMHSPPTYASTAVTVEGGETTPRRLVRNETLYPPNTVFVSVYDITEANALLASVGIGAHHVGISVYDKEYHFGRCASGTGVGTNVPCYCVPHLFREQYVVGLTPFSASEVRSLVRSMEKEPHWQGNAYHLILNNCVHFAETLAHSLLPPDVRYAQAMNGDVRLYRCWASEMVQMSSGDVVKLPVLIPPHVNRLTRGLVNFIPGVLVNRLDQLDRDAALEVL